MHRPEREQEVEALSQLLGSAPGFEQLRRTRERVEEILRVVVGDDGVLLQDFSGRIAYANAPAARLLGCESTEALLHVSQETLLSELVIETLEGERLAELPGTSILRGAPPREQTLCLCRQGSAAWVIVRTLPMHDPRGEIAASVTVLRDVTEQRRTADFREKLIGMVSHDLKNPLTAISLSAGLLERRARSLDPELAKASRRIRGAAERATRMVHDLLDLTQARLGGGIPLQLRQTDLAALVQTAVDEALAAHPQRAVHHRHHGEREARCDPDRVSQLLSNLLSNALTYSPTDSPVTVETEGRPEATLLSVRNLGPPIPPEQLSTLFEPFLRGSRPSTPSQRSVGLGLYIVKEIAAAHGGSVAVTSTAAEGTRFTLFLPRG